MLISSLYHVLHDPENFENPGIFRPERYVWKTLSCFSKWSDTPHFRFLNSAGRFESDEKLVPFGIGKRFCLGRSLAEKEYFLFFAGILQQFKLENVPGTTPPSYAMKDAKVDGILRIPPHFEIIFKSRDWTWINTKIPTYFPHEITLTYLYLVYSITFRCKQCHH